jgi:hypothetical protein
MRHLARLVLAAALVAGATPLLASPASAACLGSATCRDCSDPEAPECACVTVRVNNQDVGPCMFVDQLRPPRTTA